MNRSDSTLSEKINEAMKETFVGNYVFTDGEFNEMKKETGNRLFGWISASMILPKEDYKMIFVTLVNITQRWKESNLSDNGWLQYLADTLKIETGNSRFYDNLKKLMFYLEEDEVFTIPPVGNNKRYYCTFMAHALAPISAYEFLFEMCWNIYKEHNFDADLCDDIVSALRLKKSRKNADDATFKIGSQSYSFRAGINSLIEYRPEPLKQLITEIFDLIDRLCKNEDFEADTRLKKMVASWWNNGRGQREKISAGNRESIVKDASNLKPRYILNDRDICLRIPSFKLSAESYNKNLSLSIYSGGKELPIQYMSVADDDFVMATRKTDVNVSNLHLENLESFRIVISDTCGKTLYDSKDTLNRDFILFDSGKEVTSERCKPDGYIVYAPDYENFQYFPHEYYVISNNFIEVYPVENECICHKPHDGAQFVMFKNETSNEKISIGCQKNKYVTLRDKSKTYGVITGNVSLIVDKSIDMNSCEISVSQKTVSLNQLTPELTDETVYVFDITKLITAGKLQTVRVTCDNTVLVDSDIIKAESVSLDRDLYFGKYLGGLFEIRLSRYAQPIKAPFNARNRETNVPSPFDGSFLIKPPVISWQINEGEEMFTANATPEWYENITNTAILRLFVPQEVDCSLIFNGRPLDAKDNGGRKEYDLGRAVRSIDAEHTHMESAELKLEVKDKKHSFGNAASVNTYILERIYYKEQFGNDLLTIDGDSRTFHWNPESYLGPKNSIFRIYCGKNQIRECNSTDQDTFSIECEARDDYNIELTIVKTVSFKPVENEVFQWSNVRLGSEAEVKKLKEMRELYTNIIAIDKVVLGNSSEPNCKLVCIDKLQLVNDKEPIVYSGHMFLYTGSNPNGPLKCRNENTYEANVTDDDKIEFEAGVNPVNIELMDDNNCRIRTRDGRGFVARKTDNEWKLTVEPVDSDNQNSDKACLIDHFRYYKY